MERMSLLEVERLNVKYRTEQGVRHVLRDVSFTVEKGEIAGIVGESGSGKTTAMLAVMGLLGRDASVECEKLALDGKRPVPGQSAAMVFQDSLSCLNPSVRIGRQIAETVKIRRKCSRSEAEQRAEELLDMVGISDPHRRMRQYPSELSGGMRQRVVIAIALACEPDLIIADEPTTALDAAVQSQILLLLKRIVKETGTSLLLVSHDLGVTAALCKTVYVLHEGTVVESGNAEEIFYAPRHGYTRALLTRAGKIHQKSAEAHGKEPVQEEERRAEGEPLVRAERITKEYGAGEGLHGLTLEIVQGETLALVGESGSGKTTFAKILSGVMEADGGALFYRGECLNRNLRKSGTGRKIQMVFQDPYSALNPCLTVGEALSEAARGPRRTETESRVEEMLEMAGMSGGDARRYPADFSGGQRQRIGIARALITEPELLICDEAAASLDAEAKEQILALLEEIKERRKISCLFISHDIGLVRRISDRVAVIYGGYVVETGRTKEICSDPWHPYTKQLLEAVLEPDPLRASKIRAVPLRESDGRECGRENGRGKDTGCPFAGRCGYALDCCRRENPETYVFGDREIACFLYSEKHSGKRADGYRMMSQI